MENKYGSSSWTQTDCSFGKYPANDDPTVVDAYKKQCADVSETNPGGWCPKPPPNTPITDPIPAQIYTPAPTLENPGTINVGPSTAKCTPMQSPPSYRPWLVWYGNPKAITTPAQYLTMLKPMVKYLGAPNAKIKYYGFFLQYDNPTKNYAQYLEFMAKAVYEYVNTYATTLQQVGIHYDLQGEFQISPTNLFSSSSGTTPLPVESYGGATWDNTFYGWNNDPKSTPVDHGPVTDVATGYPYQFPAAPEYNGVNFCPYKPPVNIPGCPSATSRVAWIVMMINRIIRQMYFPDTGNKSLKPVNQITSLIVETEWGGPTPPPCFVFEFLFALCEFSGGKMEDIQPAGSQWTFFINAGPAADGPSTVGSKAGPDCQDWASYRYGDMTQTFGELVEYFGAPEFYWFNGEDGTGPVSAEAVANKYWSVPGTQKDIVAASQVGRATPTSSFVPWSTSSIHTLMGLAEAGIIGCPQSGTNAVLRDVACGCRNTVYDIFGFQDDGDEKLLKVMGPAFNRYVSNNAQAPTFSIEHLGSNASNNDFSNVCIANVGFCKELWGSSGAAGVACLQDGCNAKCGVANLFGRWNEDCFKSFLDKYVATWMSDVPPAARNVIVYDAEFIPQEWLNAYTDPDSVSNPSGKPPTSIGASLQPFPSCDMSSYVKTCEEFTRIPGNISKTCSSTCPQAYPNTPIPDEAHAAYVDCMLSGGNSTTCTRPPVA